MRVLGSLGLLLVVVVLAGCHPGLYTGGLSYRYDGTYSYDGHHGHHGYYGYKYGGHYGYGHRGHRGHHGHHGHHGD